MMKRITLLLMAQALLATGLFAQEKISFKDSIEFSANYWTGTRFYQNDKKLTAKDMRLQMKTNPEAFRYYQKAQTNNTLSFIIGFTGGFMIGYELGRLVAGKDIHWGIMGTGIGLVGITIPLDIAAIRNYKKAVFHYNTRYR